MKFKILGLFFLLVPIDSFNGLLASMGLGLPISAAYKGCLLLFFMSQTIRKKAYVNTWIGILLLFLFYFVWHITIASSEHLGATVSMVMRLMLFVGVYLYFKDYFTNREEPITLLFPVFRFSAIIITFVLFCGLFGYGVGSYGGTEDGAIGSKGYFIAGNEISALLFVVYSTVLYSYINDKKRLLLWSGLFVFSGLILSSKMAILSSLISVLYLAFFFNGKYIFLKIICFAFTFVLIIFKLIGYFDAIGEVALVERWLYFYDSGGFTKLLLSGREDLIVTPLVSLEQKGWPFILLGAPDVRTVEMDPFDTYIHFGIIGCVIIYSTIFLLLLKLYNKKHLNSTNKFVFFVFIILFIVSTIAGHILYSGMLIPYLAILLSTVNNRKSLNAI